MRMPGETTNSKPRSQRDSPTMICAVRVEDFYYHGHTSTWESLIDDQHAREKRRNWVLPRHELVHVRKAPVSRTFRFTTATADPMLMLGFVNCGLSTGRRRCASLAWPEIQSWIHKRARTSTVL
jgi:hypothetical protein